MITASGFKVNQEYKRCNRCICDNTVPSLEFDSKGECSLCKMHDKFDKAYPNDLRGTEILENKFKK